MSTNRALDGVGTFLDDRLHGARGIRVFMRKIFPDHWSFLLGEIALYSFIILLLTGTFLTLFFEPSMSKVVYHGSYHNLDGVKMSQAYASTLDISFDVRGGLLMRQIHHWAADLFVAAIMAHMIRIFFTGAYRKPREVNWLIGIILFTLALIEGLFGYSLPDDLLSGAGLRILEGVLQSIPIVGTYLAYFLFGGPFPGSVIVPRMYILHVLVIPALILALVSAHLFIMIWQKHTQMPGKGRTNTNVVGAPAYPYFAAKTGAFFFFIFGALALAGAFAQINPVWLYGPYNPVAMSAGSQPDFYMGFLEGALRVFPAWEWVIFGHTFAFNVFVPALIPLGFVFTGAALWPFIEQWITGDRSEHHINDRPRNAPTRTAIGVAIVSFWGVLWAEGANDVIADHFNISLYLTTEIARWAWIVVPILAYIITKRICLGLQRKDVHLLEHGVETGIIRQLPNGEYIEETRPVDDEARAVLESRPDYVALPSGAAEEADVPAPGMRGAIGKVRERLYRVVTESVPLPAGDGHGNGHAALEGDGHGEGEGEPNGHATVPAGGHGESGSSQSGGGPSDSGPSGGDGH
ncbi:MAG TPA: ubiquinol-cytochrome c reductase cytochrome b subunit [Streptosporangiaceae bacterium]|nr:ubiquinol-cytochrome c reductase cytochrome b subunit [Streptosporangiaceae bacterium]